MFFASSRWKTSKSIVLVIGMPIFSFIEYSLMELFRKPGN